MLPSGYTQLEYIESSGTQYIDTGFLPDSNTKVEAEFEITSLDPSSWQFQTFFGEQSASSDFLVFCDALSSTHTIYATTVDSYLSFLSVFAETNTKYHLIFRNNACSINGENQEAAGKTFNSPISMAIFAQNSYGTFNANSSLILYNFKIWDGDTLSRDFTPCKNAAGEAGLYDSVGGQFYGNEGTGVFIAGPAVAQVGDSIQETKLLAIADAIREKEWSTGFIPAEDFAARILALQDSASEYSMPLRLEVNPGAEVTAQNGEDVLTGTADADGNLTFLLPKPGIWTVTAALDGKEKTEEVAVDDYALNFVSRLPDGYQEVEYIESDSKCSIQTNLRFYSASTRLVLDMEAKPYVSGSEYIYVQSGNGNACFLYRKNATQIAFKFASTSASTTTQTLGIANQRMVIELDAPNKKLSIGDTSFNMSIASGISSAPIFLLGAIAGSGIPSKLYSAYLYSGDELIREWVPCKDPSGAAGLFDLVEGTFYGNVGTGVFTAGPTV